MLPTRETAGVEVDLKESSKRLIRSSTVTENLKAAALALSQGQALLLEGPPGKLLIKPVPRKSLFFRGLHQIILRSLKNPLQHLGASGGTTLSVKDII